MINLFKQEHSWHLLEQGAGTNHQCPPRSCVASPGGHGLPCQDDPYEKVKHDLLRLVELNRGLLRLENYCTGLLTGCHLACAGWRVYPSAAKQPAFQLFHPAADACFYRAERRLGLFCDRLVAQTFKIRQFQAQPLFTGNLIQGLPHLLARPILFKHALGAWLMRCQQPFKRFNVSRQDARTRFLAV
jgi:hypothetical protein